MPDPLVSVPSTNSHSIIITFPLLPCDVVILTSDDIEVPARRGELSKLSKYFCTLFNSSFDDAHCCTAKLPTIRCEELMECLRQARIVADDGTLELTVTQAVNLLEAASYLQMDELLSELAKIIIKRTHTRHLLQVHRYVSVILPSLAEPVWQRIINSFGKLVSEGQHKQMTREEMAEALSDKALPLTCAQEIKAIYTWKMEKCTDWQERVQLKQHELLLSELAKLDEKDERIVRKRIPNSAVITVGGWSSNGPTPLLETFNSRAMEWRQTRINEISKGTKRAYQISCFVGEDLLTGGGLAEDGVSTFHDCSLYNFSQKSWRKTCNLHDKRCYAANLAFKDSIGTNFAIACGGYNGHHRLRSAEIFNAVEHQWFRIANMSKRRSDATAILLDGGVMIAGGLDESQKHNTAERFDFGTEKWIPICGTMCSSRTGVSGVALQRSVVVVAGGFDGFRRLNSVEMHDEREGKWHNSIARMQHGRSNFGMAYMNEYIYVAGGYVQPSICAFTERYDIRADRWESLPNLHERKSALRLLHVEEHPALADLLAFEDDFSSTHKASLLASL